MATPPEDMPKFVEAYFKDTVDNLRFVKRQQWMATNYALLILGAIYWVAENTGCVARTLLTVAAVLTGVYGIYLLWDFQKSLAKYRKRLTWVYDQPYFKELKAAGLLPPDEKPLWYQPAYPMGLMAIIVVMTGIAVARLYDKFPGV
jgi:hypothetical protein